MIQFLFTDIDILKYSNLDGLNISTITKDISSKDNLSLDIYTGHGSGLIFVGGDLYNDCATAIISFSRTSDNTSFQSNNPTILISNHWWNDNNQVITTKLSDQGVIINLPSNYINHKAIITIIKTR